MSLKIAVITGASRGIGYAIASKLCGQGYLPILVARNLEKLQLASERLKSEYKLEVSPPVYAIDISQPEEVNKITSDVLDKYKSIDVLVNNAGVVFDGASEMSYEDFTHQINVNLVGAFNFIHSIVPSMKNRKQGYIFNIASRSGKIAQAHWGGYAASKFGLVGFSEALHKELSAYGVKVTALCPGAVATDMSSDEEIPQNKMIAADDLSEIILCLLRLSDNALIKDIVIECKETVRLNMENEPR